MKKVRKIYVKRNYREKKPPLVFTFVRNTCSCMLKNISVYATPKIHLADLIVNNNKTEELYNIHLHGTPTDTINYEVAMAALLDLIDDQANYVDDIADGDLATIILSGFDNTSSDYNYHKSDEVYSNSARREIKVVLTATEHATGYVWQYHDMVSKEDNMWILADCTRKAFYTYKGLTSNTL